MYEPNKSPSSPSAIYPVNYYADYDEINEAEENRRKQNRVIFVIVMILSTAVFCYHVSYILDRFLKREVIDPSLRITKVFA